MMEKIKSYLKLFRIKQWIKNGFVFCALIFSRSFTNTDNILITIKAFMAFCIVSSFVYIINDASDIEKDRMHPVKKNRPLASGKVSIKEGYILAGVMIFVACGISYSVNLLLLIITVTYAMLNILYTYKLKHIAILDVMSIAAGFILRVAAGAVAIEVQLSSWIIICTGVLSLYLAFGKRKNELYLLKVGAGTHRKTLSQYSEEYVDRILLMLLSLTIISYILYCIDGTEYARMIYTIPFVIYGTLRYEMLLSTNKMGGAPEEIFIQDKPFLVNIILWLVACLWAVAL